MGLQKGKQLAGESRRAKADVKPIEKDDRLRRPMTAYFLWLNANRTRIIAELGKGGPEVTRKGAQMWKELSAQERKPYEDQAQKELSNSSVKASKMGLQKGKQLAGESRRA